MKKYDIIEQLAKDKVLEEMCEAMCVPQNYKDDLVQEVYMILLEYEDNKIEEMYKKKQLNYFIVRIIQNQMFSKYSPFYKNYRKFSSMTEELDYDSFNNNDGDNYDE